MVFSEKLQDWIKFYTAVAERIRIRRRGAKAMGSYFIASSECGWETYTGGDEINPGVVLSIDDEEALQMLLMVDLLYFSLPPKVVWNKDPAPDMSEMDKYLEMCAIKAEKLALSATREEINKRRNHKIICGKNLMDSGNGKVICDILYCREWRLNELEEGLRAMREMGSVKSFEYVTQGTGFKSSLLFPKS